MSILALINPFNKITEVVSEFVEDKDARNKLNAALETLKQEVYIQELQTKTIPWVDALHKMQRGILSVLSMSITVYMIHSGVDDPLALMAGLAPAAGYNVVKGKGKG